MENELGFTGTKWKEYLRRKLNVELTPKQLSCNHTFNIMPKSGYHFGIPLWRCIYCEYVCQSS